MAQAGRLPAWAFLWLLDVMAITLSYVRIGGQLQAAGAVIVMAARPASISYQPQTDGDYRMYKSVFMMSLVTVLFCSNAYAGSDGPAVNLRSSTNFEQQRMAIEQDMAAGKYSELSSGDRSKVSAALNRISSSLDGADDVSQLSSQKNVEVFNDQQLVNQLLTQAAADSRMICKRERKIGTNMKTTNCLTAGERRRQKEAASAALTENKYNIVN